MIWSQITSSYLTFEDYKNGNWGDSSVLNCLLYKHRVKNLDSNTHIKAKGGPMYVCNPNT